MRWALVSEIDVLQREIDLGFLQQPDDLLEVVPLLPCDPELVALDRACLCRHGSMLNIAARRHCQVDVERTGSAADEAMTQTSDSDTRHLTPDPEGTCAQQAMVEGSQ